MDDDLVGSGTNENGSFPLLPQATVQVSVKKGDEISSVNNSLVSNITSELSGLSLETSSQATKPVNEPTVHQQEITKSVEGGDTSADANEDMSDNPAPDEATPAPDEATPAPDEATPAPDEATPVPDESTRGTDESTQGTDESTQGTDESTQGTDESTQGSEESTQSSDDLVNIHEELIIHARPPPGNNPVGPLEVETEPENRRCQLVDRTLCIVILEATLFLIFPISMTCYSFVYFHQCEGLTELPTLLLVVAFFSALTLIGRIMVNIAAIFKWSHDRDVKPMMRLNGLGECLSAILFFGEFIEFFAKYVTYSSLCNADFFGYVFYMNIFAAVFIVIRICCKCKQLADCIEVGRMHERMRDEQERIQDEQERIQDEQERMQDEQERMQDE